MSVPAYSAATVRPRRLTSRVHASGPGRPLALALLCVVALALVWVVANLVPAAQYKDAVLLHDFTLLSHPRVDRVGNFLLHLLEPTIFIIWGIALVATALARGRPRIALAVVAVMALAPFTTETLKPLVAHSHAHVDGVWIGAASWPSGHSTAALTLALCVALVTPSRWRPIVAALGGAFAVAAGCSLLILEWHMPSDVLGGYLVATLWMALAVAVLRFAEQRRPTHEHADA
jgi:membrane-associated phospholipid phosphatase